IYDAYTHELLDSINAYDDDDLYGRYLEQVDQDAFQSTVFTIQELTVALSNDTDNDGFFPELDITIDADMSFGTEWVALSVFIVDPFGIETLLYRNNEWFISGYQSSDKDITNVLLESGYQSDYYHIRAKLYDADNGLLLTTADTTRSAGLSIESEDYDDSFDSSNGHVDDDDYYGAESGGHGGALGWWSLIGLAALLFFRKK
ncbi:MAG: choice-of-anchor H family protein, partial [Pseudomonadales bacterium]|nr:choice-of-anchor H family protein [Pseudomonadales bacterium]